MMRDGCPLRHLQPLRMPIFQHLDELLAGEPPRVFKLLAVDRDLARYSLRDEADHQARRKGPGLARMIADRAELDACLLINLAPRRLLDRFAGLHEPGERRIHAGLE